MTKEQISELVLTTVADHLDVKSVFGSKTLGDHGADSLDAVEIIMTLEVETGLDLSGAADEWNMDTTVDAMIADVQKAMEAHP